MSSLSLAGKRSLTIGTRASRLALAQTALVQEALHAVHPALEIRFKTITTKGDIAIDRPLREIGGAGLFVTAIEDALRAGHIDLAVHSAKDLPGTLPEDMALAAFPPRADARDVLVSPTGVSLADLAEGARVGTSSVRRICQLRHLRPDLVILDLRGNVDTRLMKLHQAQYDAIVLAKAGLDRLGISDQTVQILAPESLLPAVAQGALALEVRADDSEAALLLAPLDDQPTHLAVAAERAFLARIGGGCYTPIAAYARIVGETLVISGMLGAVDGRMVQASAAGQVEEGIPGAARLGATLASLLLADGGSTLLAGS
jgi:hydroxymethylbilane synthase